MMHFFASLCTMEPYNFYKPFGRFNKIESRVRFIGIFVSSEFRWPISLKGPGIQNS